MKGMCLEFWVIHKAEGLEERGLAWQILFSETSNGA